MVSGLCPLKVISSGVAPQYDIVSAKQFKKGLKKGQYVVNSCLGCKANGQLMFTYYHAFGSTGDDKPVSEYLVANCLQDLKTQFPKVFAEPQFLIVRDDLVCFEY